MTTSRTPHRSNIAVKLRKISALILKVIAGYLFATAVFIDIEWLLPAEEQRQAIIDRIVNPPRGDMSFSYNPPPTASEEKLRGDLFNEFIRCGGATESEHKNDAILSYLISINNIMWSAWESRSRDIARLNNGLTIRWAQMCHTFGACAAGLPPFVKRPANYIDAADPHTYMTIDRMRDERTKALTYACGQGAREKGKLPIV